MIPSDVAARLQLTADAAVARPPSVQQVANALADLVPGQRVLAEIQSILPTGAYRALINQRDVTLALPFSAKAGDSLELEVVETEGQLTLAVVARKGNEAPPLTPERPAVETTLSRTGHFIAGLLGRSEDGDATKPALLNANQPIAGEPPTEAGDLTPLLKQAITQSGMFYESHQAQWVASRLPTESLLAEPQGSRSPVLQAFQAENGAEASQIGSTTKYPSLPNTESSVATRTTEQQATPVATDAARSPTVPAAALTQLVAPDLVPLVQQQLEALANQSYVWQGQAWPGQPMRWEIEEDGHRDAAGNPDKLTQWQTRLTLTMPLLGEVRAAIRLNGGEIVVNLSADGSEAAVKLANGSEAFRTQLEAAGLNIVGFSVARHERSES